jgi:2-oxoglutarate/2-oxoacid ferredoxin oxidoreductase subunit alpha
MSKQRLVQGNEACAHAALYAGCSFYAGYPITPSSEIMEILAAEMPRRKPAGMFVQMEDEIASIAAVIGAAWAGAKAMTATSGPGFSLMQEGLGYASITETPCVIVDCQRWGPSTGQPTKTAQGDVMQAIWGTHGDHPVVVITASNVRDIFEQTVRAFNVAEEYRVPVVLLLDEVVSHMRENIHWPEPGELQVVNRRTPEDLDTFQPFSGDGTFVPLGRGVRYNITGMAHNAAGFPAQGQAAGRELERLMAKVHNRTRELAQFATKQLEDARLVIVSFGITSRASAAAIDLLRARGIAAGMLDLKTLWPFPDFLIEGLAANVERILVPELNMGQIAREVARAAAGRCPVQHLGRVDGHLISPDQICAAAQPTGRAALLQGAAR